MYEMRGHHMGFQGHHGHGYCCCGPSVMTVEEEIKMLEEIKCCLEDQLKNVNDRLEKLKK